LHESTSSPSQPRVTSQSRVESILFLIGKKDIDIYCRKKIYECVLSPKKLNDRLTGLIAQRHFVITQESLESLDICAQSPTVCLLGLEKIALKWNSKCTLNLFTSYYLVSWLSK